MYANELLWTCNTSALRAPLCMNVVALIDAEWCKGSMRQHTYVKHRVVGVVGTRTGCTCPG